MSVLLRNPLLGRASIFSTMQARESTVITRSTAFLDRFSAKTEMV
jgi:hypothetical protein